MRPEFYLALPVFVLAAATRPRPSSRTVAWGVLAAGGLLVPWFAFAKWHMGSILPNTAGAKAGDW